MEQTRSATTPPPIFGLPPELRSHIYQHLISSPVVNVDFCKELVQVRLTNCSTTKKSPIMSLIEKKRSVIHFVRAHGLHLAATSLLFRKEFVDHLRRLGTEFHVHCHECFQKICSHLTTDLAITFPILKKIVTKLEFSSSLVPPYPGIYATLYNFRHVVNRFFGNHLLNDYIGDQPRNQREWFVVVKTVVGKVLTFQQLQNRANNIADSDDDEDDYLLFPPDLSHLQESDYRYFVRSDVKTVTTEIHSWDVTKTAWDDSWVTPARIRILDRILPTTCTDEWRFSALLRERWEGTGTNRLLCRDEIYVELNFP